MTRILINATQADEIRVAQVERNRLIDFDIERTGEESTKGNIYKGRVTAVKTDLEGAFVDYGAERHGLLSMRKIAAADYLERAKDSSNGDPVRIDDVLSVNQELQVQVEKDPYGHKKGATLSTDFSLVGRYTVLKPKSPDGGISLQITGEALERMKQILSKLDIPNGMGIILRTASKGRSQKEIQDDLDVVLRLWRDVEKAGAEAAAPRLVFQENSLIRRIVRDKFREDIEELIVDNPEVHQELLSYIRSFFPGVESRITLHEDPQPLFSKFKIEKDISRAFERDVTLPSGGRIAIDPTEALVSIDVNSARARTGGNLAETAMITNREAVLEIGRQLRLRDLGGLIVVDFIDMDDSSNRATIEAGMEEILAEDRANTAFTPISRFGLMEIQRQRLRTPLHDTSFETCPRCSGSGRVRDTRSTALSALRDIESGAGIRGIGCVQANLPVEIATYLMNEKRSELLDIERRLNVQVVLVPDKGFQAPQYRIEKINFADVKETFDTPSYERKASPTPERGGRRGRSSDFDRKKPEVQQPMVTSGHQEPYPQKKHAPPPEPKPKKQPEKADAGGTGFVRRVSELLFGTRSGQSAKPKPSEQKRSRAKAKSTSLLSGSETSRRNAPVILPNGERRADYIRRRFYDDGIARGQVLREINQMNQDAHGSHYKRLNPSVIYQATRAQKTSDAGEASRPTAKPGAEAKPKASRTNDRPVAAAPVAHDMAVDEQSDQQSTTRNSGAQSARAKPANRSSRKGDQDRRSARGGNREGRGGRQRGDDRQGSPRAARAASKREPVDGNVLHPHASGHKEPSVAELFLALDEEEKTSGNGSDDQDQAGLHPTAEAESPAIENERTAEPASETEADGKSVDLSLQSESVGNGGRAKNDPRFSGTNRSAHAHSTATKDDTPEMETGLLPSDASTPMASDETQQERALNDPRD